MVLGSETNTALTSRRSRDSPSNQLGAIVMSLISYIQDIRELSPAIQHKLFPMACAPYLFLTTFKTYKIYAFGIKQSKWSPG